jgi:hypothetical protein
MLQRCGGKTCPPGTCDHDGRDRDFRRRSRSAEGAIPRVVHEVLRSPGSALDAGARAYMEPRFGHDFSRVRVHTDATAARSAEAVHALAYTVGRDVVFGAGQYAPSTQAGRRLLAHELTHVVQQGDLQSPAVARASRVADEAAYEVEADRVADRATANGMIGLGAAGSPRSLSLQRKRIGTAVTHPAGSRSPYRVITADFDGREFVVKGDGTVVLRVHGQSGRPYSVRPADARACGGSTADSYLNNPRYVGIADNGPIPEGEYRFSATQMSTFTGAEQLEMMLGGSYTDPFGASLHGGDWGAGRVPLTKIRVLPSPFCGNTSTRSGFFLHGGIMPGSSGCIDIGNSGFNDLVALLQGYRSAVVVRVRYPHPAPTVGAVDRALGRFTYPPGENPTVIDRVRSLFDF